jgi:hypothetical protein
MKKVLCLIVAVIMLMGSVFALGGCSSKSMVVGVWQSEKFSTLYRYVYANGTGDKYGIGYMGMGGDDHFDQFTWKLNGSTYIEEDKHGSYSYTIKDGIMYDMQNNIVYRKVSDATNVDMPIK